MTPEEIYAVWAPGTSPWSAWAKPVLFTVLNRVTAPPELVLPEDLPWVRGEAARTTAVVVDLPGEAAVLAGLALARQGYQPVPLFNGCLAPGMVVDVTPLAAALLAGSGVLRQQRISRDAPPAFLLDSRRQTGKELVLPGRFDNRWAVVPQDMPSGNHLRAAGIGAVLVRAAKIQEDLTHILCRYQEAGLVLSQVVDDLRQAQPLAVTAPFGFRSFWYRLGVFAGLRRNSAGGFGAVVPQPGSSGSRHRFS